MSANPYDDPQEVVCVWCDKPLTLDDDAEWVTHDDIMPRCYAVPTHADDTYAHEPYAVDVARLEVERLLERLLT